MKWERSFEVRVPRRRAWDVFTDREDVQEWNNVLFGDAYISAGAVQVEITDEVEHERIAWTERHGDVAVEGTITFTEIETGTRITLTTVGFGDGDAFSQAMSGRSLGWGNAMQDLVTFLESGVHPKRLHTWKSAPGMSVLEEPGGLRVVAVTAGACAEKAGVSAGDRIVRVSGAPVFGLSDVWLLQRLVEPGTEVTIEYIRDGELLSGSAPMGTLAQW